MATEAPVAALAHAPDGLAHRAANRGRTGDSARPQSVEAHLPLAMVLMRRQRELELSTEQLTAMTRSQVEIHGGARGGDGRVVGARPAATDRIATRHGDGRRPSARSSVEPVEAGGAGVE